MNTMTPALIQKLQSTVQEISQASAFQLILKKSPKQPTLLLKQNSIQHTFNIEYIAYINANNLTSVISHLKQLPLKNTILFSQYINPKIAAKLREQQCAFIDLAKNLFIKTESIYLFVSGEKPFRTKMQTTVNPAFNSAGIKILFACLSLPGLEANPYRKIAEKSGVSLGSVETVISALDKTGYLIQGTNKRRLVNKKILLNRWCIAYAEKLRPKLILDQFHCQEANWWKTANLTKELAFWSGEVAAALLTKHLKPEYITLYANSSLPRLQVKHALRRDKQAEIEILQKFWNFKSEHDDENIAPIILIYADLIAIGGDRNQDIAEILYEQYLDKLIN